MSITTQGHVAVFAFPFGSHAAPLLTLVHRISAAAPNIHFSFFNTAKSNEKVFSNTTFHNIKWYDVDEGGQGGDFGNLRVAVDLFIKGTPENYRKRLEEVVNETGIKVTCLLTDAFLWFGGDMAQEMGVPWVAFWTAGPCTMLVHLYTDVILNNLALHENADQTLSFLPGMSKIHAADLPPEINRGTPLGNMLYNMATTIPRATAVALNSFHEIDRTVNNDIKSKVKNLLNIGLFSLSSPPVTFPDENNCISWLNNHKSSSVAYISFGSLLTPPPVELVALAEALEAKRVPFLWSLRDTSQKHFIEGKSMSLGKVVNWVPQQQVLQHSAVGVFITHCGWNSVVESISGGVPMICRPYFGDQMLNSRVIEDVLGIGISVMGGVFTKTGTVDALDAVLVKGSGKKMKVNVAILKQKAIMAVDTNGSSTKKFRTLLEVVTTSRNS